jgi:uncharacterized DUF497 family protein
VYPAPLNSQSEERFKAIGKSDAGRYVLIVFTLRARGGKTYMSDQRALYAPQGDRTL